MSSSSTSKNIFPLNLTQLFDQQNAMPTSNISRQSPLSSSTTTRLLTTRPFYRSQVTPDPFDYSNNYRREQTISNPIHRRYSSGKEHLPIKLWDITASDKNIYWHVLLTGYRTAKIFASSSSSFLLALPISERKSSHRFLSDDVQSSTLNQGQDTLQHVKCARWIKSFETRREREEKTNERISVYLVSSSSPAYFSDHEPSSPTISMHRQYRSTNNNNPNNNRGTLPRWLMRSCLINLSAIINQIISRRKKTVYLIEWYICLFF